MRPIAYETFDVFAEQRFGGNPLAVIADARALSSTEMQSIAREFNYSESTFVLPPRDLANTAQVRIFTPASEIPFAGHPNVGTAFALARAGSLFGKPLGDVMRFEEGAGLVEINVRRHNGVVEGASIRAPQDLEIGGEVSPATVAACVSLRVDEVVTARHEPVFASVGLPFVFAELKSLDALQRAAPNIDAFNAAAAKHPNERLRFSLHLYVRTGENKVRARMFAPLSNVFEDPATGSAAAALGGLFSSLSKDGALELAIEQGVEMGRPSFIGVSVTAPGGKRSIAVAGKCVPVMRGTIEF
ncbi:MAG: PhzF family phenazine biosynthesis isomerase [Alphaproteobacteria bacterium]|nr:PhzF family phenazine biosynthesis isomerase [Alphaproteobacteria bacterium]